MRIEKITAITYNQFVQPTQKKEELTSIENKQYISIPYGVAFGARVDKGLTRFYEANKERMPKTLKKFIEKLPDKTIMTPQQANKEAFAALATAGMTVLGVKAIFSDEELFKDVKKVEETNANRGILSAYRKNKEILAEFDEGILQNNEDLSVWLLKKIYMEAKTLEEINEDFSKEINPSLKAEYIKTEDSEDMIKHSTLKALGIKMPAFEYMQSLRYTRDGYSDMVGDKISESLQNAIDRMPPEHRTPHNRREISNIDNWWNSLSQERKLEMIADKLDEIEMLKIYNEEHPEKIKSTKKTEVKSSTETEGEYSSKGFKRNREKVDSNLGRDELFKIWASANLEKFNLGLSDEDKAKIQIRRDQRRAEFWKSMSYEERTAYIDRLKRASEPTKYAMIDAWNQNPDIVVKLSLAHRKNCVKNPVKDIYSENPQGHRFSTTMTEFWAENPEYSERLGESIKASHAKVKEAIQNDKFESLKFDIMKARSEREYTTSIQISAIEKVFPAKDFVNEPQHMQDFMNAYFNALDLDILNWPEDYLRDFFKNVKELPMETVVAWTKFINKEELDDFDNSLVEKISKNTTFEATLMNHALEATMAKILYACTDDPRVYSLTQTECKYLMLMIRAEQKTIPVVSESNNKTFIFNIKRTNVDISKINEMYNDYKKPLTSHEINEIISQYFMGAFEEGETYHSKEDAIDLLRSLQAYISTFGQSAKIIFSTNKEYSPEIREAFAQKFSNNAPAVLLEIIDRMQVSDKKSFERENDILKLNENLKRKFPYLPKGVADKYFHETNKLIRNLNDNELNLMMLFTQERKSLSDLQTKYDLILERDCFSVNSHIPYLIAEQVLADAIYDASGEDKVYALRLEELLDLTEELLLSKKFPSDEYEVKSNILHEHFKIRIDRRLNLKDVHKNYRKYDEDILQEMLKLKETGKLDKEKFLLILNPYEETASADKYVMMRIEEVAKYVEK